jgi:hypothetical protein
MRLTPVTSTRRASVSERRRGSWRLLAVAVLAMVVGMPAGAAHGHDGVGASYRGKLGRYLVYVYDGFPGDRGLVDYRVVVLEAATQEPVYDVDATVYDVTDGSASPAPVQVFGNVSYFSLPNAFPQRKQVRLALAGALGDGATTFRVHGVAPAGAELDGGIGGRSDGPGDWLALAGGLLGATVLITALALRLRRGG